MLISWHPIYNQIKPQNMLLIIYFIGCIITSFVITYLFYQMNKQGVDFMLSDLCLCTVFCIGSWFTLLMFIGYDLYEIITSPSIDRVIFRGKHNTDEDDND